MKLLTSSALVSIFAFTLIGCEDEFVDPNFDPTAEATVTPPGDLANVTNVNFSSPDPTGANEGLTQVFLDDIFEGINAERVAIGLEPLLFSTAISEIAEDHNEFLQDLNGNSSTLRINHDGFDSRADDVFDLNFDLVGENVAAVRNFASEDVSAALLAAWNNSAVHRANIERDFTHTGISVLVDSFSGTVYATQIFARR